MGVFNITPRSVTLQAGAINAQPRRYAMPNVHVANTTAQWRGAERLGKGITDMALAIGRIASDMAHEQRMIQDNETETAFVDAMRVKMEDPENGLLGRVKMAGNSETLQGCVSEGQDYFKSAAEDLLKEKGYTGDRKKLMLMRLKEAAQPFERSMSRGVLEKSQQIKVAAADNNYQSLFNAWQGHRTDEDATRSVVDSYRASLRVRGMTDEQVNGATDKVLRSMAYDYATANIANASEAQLKHLEEQLDQNGGDIFAFNPVLDEYFSGKDPFAATVDSKDGVSPKDGIKTMIAKRRDKIDDDERVRLDAIAAPGFEAANTIWDPKNPTQRNPNRLDGTEKAIEGLREALDKKGADGKPALREGSAARTTAARNLATLEQTADAIAGEELMLALVKSYRENPNEPKKIWIAEERDKDGKITKEGYAADDILKNSRKARLAEQVQAQFDANIAPSKTARHAERVAELKLKQLAAAADRGAYHKEIYNAAMKGEISIAEWQELYSGFDEVWTKGSDGNISRKQLFARNALSTIQTIFGGDIINAFEYNAKTGTLKEKKDSGYAGLKYGKGWIKGKLSAAQVGELATWAAELSRYDGEVLTKDPITGSTEKTYFGEKIDPAKGIAFDAGEYFKKFCQKMKNDMYIEGQTDYIYDLASAAIKLDAQDKVRMRGYGDEISNRSAATKKDVIIKKPNTKGVGVATKK